jgi:glycosyltransferase involved in cell wall biosynthesis
MDRSLYDGVVRLAWFTPLEPVRSGISTYSAMILPRLRHEIDVFVDLDAWRARKARAVRGADGYWSTEELGGQVYSAHDFLPRHARRAYDLVVYQLGNAACHDYMWPYLMRRPGLVVLHDRQVHHARARTLLQQNREADYRAELASAGPDSPAQAPPGVADWVVAGVGNMAAWLWPLTRDVVRASRAVAVHYPRVADEIRDAHPEARVLVVRHGTPDLFAEAQERRGAEAQDGTSEAQERRSAEAQGGRGITFAAFGLISPEKRIPQILGALAGIRAVAPNVRLKLVGGIASHYDVQADAERLGVTDLVEITGHVSDAEFDRHIAETDVCLCLRWPSSREASGPWLRALAAGKPTVITDLAHLVDVPTVDPRTWQTMAAPHGAADALRPLPIEAAVAVSIDILDEDHSLILGMRRLALDADLRASIGRAARARFAAEHTLEVMTDDYEAAIAAAAALPTPDPATRGLPRHLLADGSDTARRLSAEVGVTVDVLNGPAPHE